MDSRQDTVDVRAGEAGRGKVHLLAALTALAAAGVSPNLFWVAEAGYAGLNFMALRALVPAAGVLVFIGGLAAVRGDRRLLRRLLIGGAAGLAAWGGLESVRVIGFHLGGMPGSMPKLLGVLLLNRIMVGPSAASNAAGWAYHAWNGVCFGITFALLFGRKPVWWAVAYALVIGGIFLISPAVHALGVGFFALDMPGMIATVFLAHAVYGLILGLLTRRWMREDGWLLSGAA